MRSAAPSATRRGAIVVFQGVTREVAALDYEAYAEMAQERIEAILRECVAAPWALRAAAAEHRVGRVPLGEPSVIVAVSAAAPRAKRSRGPGKRSTRQGRGADLEARGHTRWRTGDWAPGSGARRVSGARLTHIDDARPRADGRRAARSRPPSAWLAPEHGCGCRAPPRAPVRDGAGPKGEVLAVARLAGVQAAKQTGQLIPLAHPLMLTFVDVERQRRRSARGSSSSSARCGPSRRTGVEMEAMTAAAVAALTVYDMVKGLERGIVIEQVVLLEKRGGRSDYRARRGLTERMRAVALITISTSKARGHR